MNDKEIEAFNLTKSPETVLEEFAREVQELCIRLETYIYLFSKKQQLSIENRELELQGISLLLKAMNSNVASIERYIDHKKNTKSSDDFA
jgi:hypothetical protein